MFWPVHCHPDFGYLAPTSRFWQLVRVGAIAGTVGILAGSISIIAFSQRPEIDRLREDFAETVISSTPFDFASYSDHASAQANASCVSQTGASPDNKCPPASQRAPQAVHEGARETKRRAAGSTPPGRGIQDPSAPAGATPPAPSQVTAKPAIEAPASTAPLVASQSAPAQQRRAAGSDPSASAPTIAAVEPTPSEPVLQRPRRKYDGRRTRESARSDPQSRIARVDRRGVTSEPGRNGSDREPGRYDGNRLGNYQGTQLQERRGSGDRTGPGGYRPDPGYRADRMW